MVNGISRLFKGQPLEWMTTGEDLDDCHQNDPKEVFQHFALYESHPPKMMSQQLIDDLAKLRENTTIIGRDPAEEVRHRQRCPFFELGDMLLWPPAKEEFYADRYSEKSSSPSMSFTSEPSNDLENWNECVSIVEPRVLLRSPTHHRDYYHSSPRLEHDPSAFKPKAPSPTPGIFSHIIGEDDPFNPFSYHPIPEDKDVHTPTGKIVSPIPKLSTAAAIADLEVIAAEGVVEKEFFPSKESTNFSRDWTSRLISSEEEAVPSKQDCPTSPVEQSNAERRDVVYRTGPKPQLKLVNDMIALLSLKPGSLKDEKMKQLWG